MNTSNKEEHADRFLEIKAKVDDLQKCCANLVGNYNNIDPQLVYSRFCEIDVYLPSVIHYFVGSVALENKDRLLNFLFKDALGELLVLIVPRYAILSSEIKLERAKQTLKELKVGKILTFKDMKGEDFTVRYATDKYTIVQGLQMFQNGKKVADRAMTDLEMLNYLMQYENR